MLTVIDTNVVVSALRSVSGASNAILQRLALGEFRVALSTALCLEYEAVLLRPNMAPAYTSEQLSAFIDSLCSIAVEAPIFFRWRPFLRDPEDDLVFECALAAGASRIITHNIRDFEGVDFFRISVVTPNQFLRILTQ